MALFRQARAAGVRVSVTHAFETAVGRAGALHVAAAIAAIEQGDGVQPLACGLDGGSAAADDLATSAASRTVNGALVLGAAPGLGVHWAKDARC